MESPPMPRGTPELPAKPAGHAVADVAQFEAARRWLEASSVEDLSRLFDAKDLRLSRLQCQVIDALADRECLGRILAKRLAGEPNRSYLVDGVLYRVLTTAGGSSGW